MGKVPPLKPAGEGEVDVLFLAAECSGDELGAALIEDCVPINGGAKLWAAGGAAMAAACDNFIANVVDNAAMGFFDVICQLPFFMGYIDAMVKWIAAALPKRVCFIDSPSLHLRIAEKLFKMGIAKKSGGPVSLYYYVAPQVWAWKPKRKHSMAKIIDSLAVLFEFEVKHFEDSDLPVTYVGHPLMNGDIRSTLRYSANGALLLLPGSRPASVRRIFPTMLEAAMEPQLKEVKSIACLYPTEAIGKILEEQVSEANCEKNGFSVELVSTAKAAKRPIATRLVMVSAGTMSLRCALDAIPGVIVYRTHPLTYLLGRYYVRVTHLGIASIILGYEYYPEFIQGAADSSSIANKLAQFLHAGKDFAVIAEELRRKMDAAHISPAEWLLRQLH